MILGTAQFGFEYGISNVHGKPSLNNVKDILNFSLDNQISKLDTAFAYGDSERIIGESGISKKFDIISKIPSNLNQLKVDNKNIVNDLFFKSIQNLKVEKLYAYLLHSIDELALMGDVLWNSMLDLKNSGYVDKIGYSVYSPSQLDLSYEKYKPDVIQIPMNVLDREFERTGWLEKLKSDKVEIHVRSVFLQGLLLMSYQDQFTKFPNHMEIWKDWHNYLENNQITPLQACLGFINGKNLVDEIVLGVNTTEELMEIVNFKDYSVQRQFSTSSTDENLIYPSKWKI